MSAARVPIFIKIKYNQATRKVTVPDYPPPVWAKLAAAITDRFAIPDSQSIALQYLDSDGDLITISSQIEFDELWNEMTLTAKPTQKDGVDHKTLRLELVLIDDKPKAQAIQAGTASSEKGPTPNFPVADPVTGSGNLEPAPTESESTSLKGKGHLLPGTPAPDPPEYPINPFPSSNSQTTPIDTSRGLSALITAIDAIAPKLHDSLGGYAQLIVQVTDQLSDTCRVISDHLQKPPVHPVFSHPSPPPRESHPSAQLHNPPDSPPHPTTANRPVFPSPPTASTTPFGHSSSIFPPFKSTQPDSLNTNTAPACVPVPTPHYPLFRYETRHPPDNPMSDFGAQPTRVPEKTSSGAMGWTLAPSYTAPLHPTTCQTRPQGGLGFAPVQAKTITPMFASNRASSPHETVFEGVGLHNVQASSRSSFTTKKCPSILEKSVFRGLVNESVSKHSPARSPHFSKESILTDSEKDGAPDFSDVDTGSWSKPYNHVTGSPMFKNARCGGPVGKQDAAPRGNDNKSKEKKKERGGGLGSGAAEKKKEPFGWGIEVPEKKNGKRKGPVSWADAPRWSSSGWATTSPSTKPTFSAAGKDSMIPDSPDDRLNVVWFGFLSSVTPSRLYL
ncbi:hypothetical protein PCANC_09968 [Puccinia coronata f. sp. avenae]|uniref:PB1 domain-containing protein n=1 Tax=Puccinia coronata f. sp. avenae TaxID=200324 RepID=A0A2N5T145_9BASI|nr:hypothetical protein PCANC_09968 [Puccinia coronata f. sp. avenae]